MRAKGTIFGFALAVGLCWPLTVVGALQWPLGPRATGEVADLIEHLLTLHPRVDGEPLAEPSQLLHFYRSRNFKPAWIERDGVSVDSSEVLKVVRQSWIDGLQPEDYHLEAIEKRLNTPATDHLELAQLELLLSDAFLHYSHDVRYGRSDPHRIHPDWNPPARAGHLADRLREAVAGHRAHDILAAMAPPHPGYQRLRVALARLRVLERRGGWPRLPAALRLKLGDRDDAVVTLRERLAASGDLLDEEPVQDERLFDEPLSEAVRRFQRRHGLPEDGRLAGGATVAAMNVPAEVRRRQVELNMERWRWFPDQPDRRFIMINLAGLTLAAFEENRVVKEMAVDRGGRDGPIPLINSKLDSVLFNPSWEASGTSLLPEILAEARRDHTYLSRMGFKLLDSDGGREVEMGSVRWRELSASRFPYRLLQEPGPTNLLGQVAFIFPTRRDLCLQGTPTADLPRGPESAGCMAVKEPSEVAAYLLRANGGWSAEAIRATVAGRRSRKVELTAPVPIYFAYWTAWADDNNEPHFREDIYHYDRALDLMLDAHSRTR